MHKVVRSQPSNWILRHLPAQDLRAVSMDLKPVRLARDTEVFQADRIGEYIYFPTDAVISFIGDTGEGGSVEVCSVGSEGAAGISAILGKSNPFRSVVQVDGDVLIGKASALRRHFQKRSAFHDAILQYYDHLLLQISYLGICNNNHRIDQRFSRWLLMVQDRAGTNTLKFTQDAIAGVLGTRRATISVAAAALQSAGLIAYTPGTITIKSRKALMKAACACYRILGRKGLGRSLPR